MISPIDKTDRLQLNVAELRSWMPEPPPDRGPKEEEENVGLVEFELLIKFA